MWVSTVRLSIGFHSPKHPAAGDRRSAPGPGAAQNLEQLEFRRRKRHRLFADFHHVTRHVDLKFAKTNLRHRLFEPWRGPAIFLPAHEFARD